MKGIYGWLAGGVVVGAMLIGSAAFVGARSSDLESPRTLRFKTIESQSKTAFVDTDQSKNSSAGDLLIISETLLDFETAKAVMGSATTVCTRLIQPGRFQCESTINVNGGRVETAGIWPQPGGTTWLLWAERGYTRTRAVTPRRRRSRAWR